MEEKPVYNGGDDNPLGTVLQTNENVQLLSLPGSFNEEQPVTNGKLLARLEYRSTGGSLDSEFERNHILENIRESRKSSRRTHDLNKAMNGEAVTDRDPVLTASKTRKAIFADAEEMKREVRQKMLSPEYNVKVFYKKKGIWPLIATNPFFEYITLAVIGLNSIWLWIDSDLNDEAVLLDADWPFQVAENSFCAFFFFEWSIRFLSFEDKRNCVQDAWFVFDSVLVGMMVFETWIMSIVIVVTSSGGGGMGNTSVLRLLRLLRLTRISRLARLLQALPELLVMIKGMLAATRSVALTLLLLVFILYVFGIVQRLLSNDTEVGEKYFPSVPTAMGNLVLHGALLDNVGVVMDDLSAEPQCAVAYALVIFMAALTMMNMLVGVLCEVVSAVSATEKEEMAVSSVRNKITSILESRNGNDMELRKVPSTRSKAAVRAQDMTITKDDFEDMMGKQDAVIALKEVGIDAETLIDYAKIIFQSDEKGKAFDGKLSLQEFMNWALQLRSTNQATVKDISDLRKFIHEQNTNRNKRLKSLIDEAEKLEVRYRSLAGKQKKLKWKVKHLRTAVGHGEHSGSLQPLQSPGSMQFPLQSPGSMQFFQKNTPRSVETRDDSRECDSTRVARDGQFEHSEINSSREISEQLLREESIGSRPDDAVVSTLIKQKSDLSVEEVAVGREYGTDDMFSERSSHRLSDTTL